MKNHAEFKKGHHAATSDAEQLMALDQQRRALLPDPDHQLAPDQEKQLHKVLHQMADKHEALAAQIRKGLIPHLQA